ncbi:hypothetical protein [Halorubrum sp. C191]|uniref:hypothetical protein n=1 Tax=Halorubrum sp. C191 TaxID=1383842 RepID=UPI0011819794|nr:hypothetical protein [Halorubrum sp. C191]
MEPSARPAGEHTITTGDGTEESITSYWDDSDVTPVDDVFLVGADAWDGEPYSWPASKLWLQEAVRVDPSSGGSCPECGGQIDDPVERYDGVVFCSIGCLNDSV